MLVVFAMNFFFFAWAKFLFEKIDLVNQDAVGKEFEIRGEPSKNIKFQVDQSYEMAEHHDSISTDNI